MSEDKKELEQNQAKVETNEIKPGQPTKKRKILFWSLLATGVGVIIVVVLLLIFLLPKDEKFDIDLGSNVSVEDGTLTGNGSYKKGDSVTIVAEDIDGYRFTGWSYGGSIISTDKEYTFEISEETEGEYTSNYAKIYSISTFDNKQYGSFTVAPTEAIAGETVTVSYEVNSENQEKHQLKRLYYVTAGQSEQITIENNRFTMPEGNVTIYAEFNNLYNINLTTNLDEEVDLTGQGTYIENESVTISAPNVDGYRFRNWTYNGSITITSQEYTIQANSTTQGTYIANYDVLYQISTSSPNGVVTIIDNKTEAIAGESVEFTIAPNENYRLIEVKLNDQPLQEQNGKYTFEMPEGDANIVVTYIQQLEVTLESNIELADSSTLYGGGKYDINSSVELYAPVNTVDEEGNNYRLIGFKYNDSVDLIESIDEGIYTFTLTEQTAGRYTAVYEREYQLTVNESSKENVVLTKIMASQGDSITFTATTDIVGEDNITIQRLKIQSNGQEIEYTNQDNQYTFIMPAGDVEISLEVSETLNIIKDFEISGNTITKYTGSSSEVVVPESYQTYTTEDGSTILCEGDDVLITRIGNSAFQSYSSLTQIALPSTLKIIGDNAFYECSNLTEIVIPEGVLTIEDSAFFDCRSLTKVTLPSTLILIKDDAFYNCSILAIVINNSSTLTITKGSTDNGYVGYYALEISQTEGEIIVENNILYYVNTINDSQIALAPSNRELTAINIKEGTTSINKSAFSDCSNLKSVVMPKSLQSVGDYAFSNCTSLKSINLPNTLTTIEHNSFTRSGLESIELPNSVSTFGVNAFSYTNLESFTIPENVLSINNSILAGCENLKTVIIHSNNFYTCIYEGSTTCSNLLELDDSVQFKVLASIVDDEDNVNTYMNDSANFTRTLDDDGVYYTYTKVVS